MSNVKNALVVGGGSAGLITAIILKKLSNIDVSIVYSSKIGIIGVGEGCTEHFSHFMQIAEIDKDQIIREADATYKAGIWFKGWYDSDYYHAVNGDFTAQYKNYYYILARQIAYEPEYLLTNYTKQHKLILSEIQDIFYKPWNGYHFNTFKLNNLLFKIANDLNIKIYDDEVIDIKLKLSGEIESIIGEKSIYDSDFFIDCTGFKKLLITKMGAKWQSYSDYLRMNSAIVFQSEDEDQYNLFSLAEAMNYGWRFKTPVWGRHGNGYIYDSNYINEDDAKDEIEKLIGSSINIGRSFKFDPGKVDKAWIKNCIAIGLSSSFVEPLEASSIGSTIHQCIILSNLINGYNNETIKTYNKLFDSMMDNIRDFIILHYMTKKTNTNFWKDVSNIKIPNSLEERLKIWKHRLPVDEDFEDYSEWRIFKPSNFIYMLSAINFFDKESIKKEFELLPIVAKIDSDTVIKNIKKQDFNNILINHKDAIELIRKRYEEDMGHVIINK
jgi:hypothetical protein